MNESIKFKITMFLTLRTLEYYIYFSTIPLALLLLRTFSNAGCNRNILAYCFTLPYIHSNAFTQPSIICTNTCLIKLKTLFFPSLYRPFVIYNSLFVFHEHNNPFLSLKTVFNLVTLTFQITQRHSFEGAIWRLKTKACSHPEANYLPRLRIWTNTTK